MFNCTYNIIKNSSTLVFLRTSTIDTRYTSFPTACDVQPYSTFQNVSFSPGLMSVSHRVTYSAWAHYDLSSMDKLSGKNPINQSVNDDVLVSF